MSRFLLGCVVIGGLTLQLGCGTFLSSRPADDEPVVYSIGDVPAAKHAPRSLESLVQNRSATAASVPANQSTLANESSTGRLGMDQVRLDDEVVQIEADESTASPPTPEQAAQLPLILEQPPQDLASPTKIPIDDPSIPHQSDEPTPGRTAATDQDAVAKQQTAPADPAPPQALEESPTDSPMKLVVRPTEDPADSIPPELNALFEQSKLAPPIDAPPVDARPIPASVEPVDENEVANHGAPSDSVQRVAFIQDSSSPVNKTISDTSVSPETDDANNDPDAVDESGDGVAPRNQPKQLTWKDQLEQTMHLLQQETESDVGLSTRHQIQLHLLKIINGSFDPQQPLQWVDTPADQVAFWTHQLAAINTLLNQETDEPSTAAPADQLRKATRASAQLRQAADALANVAALRIDHSAFCTEVKGFGQYTPAQTVFLPGQQVLIYCEIDNFALRRQAEAIETPPVRQTASRRDDYTAELRGEYSIISADNRVVSQFQYQPVRDSAQRRRRDFYMYFPVTIPDLPPGDYRLQLLIEDVVGDKVASSDKPLAFRVASRATPSQPAVKTTGQVAPPARHRR